MIAYTITEVSSVNYLGRTGHRNCRLIYRGDVIHRKAILVEVEGYKNTKLFPTPVDSLHFVINDSLNKYFHLIRKSENRDLHHCAEALFKRTLDGFSEILSESENLDFDKKHQKII